MTSEQLSGGVDSKAEDDLDEVDMLEATIDPRDVESLARVRAIQQELSYEEKFIKCKIAYRYAMQASNPFKLHE